MKHSPMLITLYAAALLLLGAVLLFIPTAFSGIVGQTDSGSVVFVQLLAAAVIGFAATNWIARHSPLGGIYGRAIILGNQSFSLIGTFVLLRRVSEEPTFGGWVLLSVLASGAILHSVLLLRGPRPDTSREPPEAA